MLENVIELFVNNTFQYITGINKPKGALVKKHSVNFRNNGEFSFPNLLKSWHGLLNEAIIDEDREKRDLLYCIGKSIEDFIAQSENWCLKISKITIKSERLHIYVDRQKSISYALLHSEINCKWVSNNIEKERFSNVFCDSTCTKSNDLTSVRMIYLQTAIGNLYSLAVNGSISYGNKSSIFISNKSSNVVRPVDSNFILCGTVLNAKTGIKETSISADDYIHIRHNEIVLIAQHKYGVRVSSDSKWKDFLAQLGHSVVIFELLQIKPSNAVKINFECPSVGSSKGAAFVLYNCARLESILRSYHDRVNEGYPPLPPIEEVDFSLLTQEEEWTLVFNYILGFPSLLTSCVSLNDNVYEFKPHNICNFLSAMVILVSQYYRKVRILTEPRKHLLPVMFARIYLLKALNDTLKTCLAIINIESVSQM